MDYIQFFTLLGTMLAGFVFMYQEFKSAQTEMKTDLKNIDRDIRSDLKNIDREIREEIRIQSSRSDQLYTMFIDLLKSKKDRTDP